MDNTTQSMLDKKKKIYIVMIGHLFLLFAMSVHMPKVAKIVFGSNEPASVIRLYHMIITS